MTFTKPVKLQKVADFEELVRRYFPHIEWKFYASKLTATYMVDGGIVIEATRKYMGKGKQSDYIEEWAIDCSPGGRGRTIEECLENWRNSIKSSIAYVYEPKYDFQRKEIKEAKAGVKKLSKIKPLEECFKWVLFCSQMELGKDVPIPVDPYADLRD